MPVLADRRGPVTEPRSTKADGTTVVGQHGLGDDADASAAAS
jgi:hypothetical protein